MPAETSDQDGWVQLQIGTWESKEQVTVKQQEHTQKETDKEEREEKTKHEEGEIEGKQEDGEEEDKKEHEEECLGEADPGKAEDPSQLTLNDEDDMARFLTGVANDMQFSEERKRKLMAKFANEDYTCISHLLADDMWECLVTRRCLGKINKGLKALRTEASEPQVVPSAAMPPPAPVSGAVRLPGDNPAHAIYLFPCETKTPFDPEKVAQAKVLLIVGQTGSGKTTLMNALVNYLAQNSFDSGFRYVLVDEQTERSQAESQTDHVAAYYIPSLSELMPPMVLIDSPGFGDTRGIERDGLIKAELGRFFENEVDTVDAIIFVANAGAPRLTHTQRYIFDATLSLFGKDIEDNILLAMTFADDEAPQVEHAIRADKFPYRKGYKFNNSGVLSASLSPLNRAFWDLAMGSFKELIADLHFLLKKSLKLTKEVIQERERLATTIAALRPEVERGLVKLESMLETITVLKSLKGMMDSAKHFTIDESYLDIQKIDLPPGKHTTTCLTCNRTCHQSCIYADDADKVRCASMDRTGHCTVCPLHCIWSIHKNVPYIIKHTMMNRKVRSEQLYQRYTKYQSDKTLSQQVLEGTLMEFINLQSRVVECIQSVYQSVSRLREIALLPSSLSVPDYLDLMIVAEREERRAGFLSRIKHLAMLKEQQELVSQIGNSEFTPFASQQQRMEVMLKEALANEPQRNRGMVMSMWSRAKTWRPF